MSLRAACRFALITAALGAASAFSNDAAAQLAAIPVASAGADPCVRDARASEWRFVVAPYVWMSGINGELGVRDLSADVDISFGDVLSKLRFAAMGTLEAGYGPWRGIV